MKVPTKDAFAFRDFYHKIPFHLLGIVDFECMSEIPSERKTGKQNQDL